MAKVAVVKVSSTVRAIVALDAERTTTNGNGKESVYTHRMYLKPSPTLNVAFNELAKQKNEAGKTLSFGAKTSDGSYAIDLKAGEAKRFANMAGATAINQLVGAGYTGVIVFRPKGSEYTTREGETLVVGSTHVAREGEEFALSIAMIEANAYAAARMAMATNKVEDEVLPSFGFGAMDDSSDEENDESHDTGFKDGEPEGEPETPADEVADTAAAKAAAKAAKAGK